MNVLFETALKDFHTSGITNKNIHAHGTGRTQFVKAILNGQQSLMLLYEVESSHDDNKHFSVNGQLMAGLQHGYAVQLQFENISNIVPSDFLNQPYSIQEQIIKQVFDKADVKVQCDCGSFYWQGISEEDASKDHTYLPFTGTPGTGKWMTRHNASGNTPGSQLCKHLWAVKEQIDSDIPQIIKYLGSGALTSQATSTQQTNELEIQEQPAGLPEEPKQGVPKDQTINSEKAEDVVSADIEAIKSNNELKAAPTLNTSEVESKSDKADTEAQEGTEPVEPPIEKPEIPEELEDQKVDEIENKVLETPLDTNTKHAMNEQFNRIYKSATKKLIEQLREELFYRGYRNDPLFQGSELLPNENSKVLFVATDADHAYQFAIGQTTVGDQMVFEVYDIPVQKLNIYNLEKDPDNIREESMKNGGTGVQYFDQDFMTELLQSKGYDGWTKLDRTVFQDEDDMPGNGRITSQTWELAIIGKDKYKPIDRLIGHNGDFTDEQLQYLIDKYDMPFLQNELWTRGWENNYPQEDDDGFEALLAKQEQEEKRTQELKSQERDRQDADQQNLFDSNELTERQKLRKRYTKIAQLMNGYGEGLDIKEAYEKFNKLMKELVNSGYKSRELQIVNRIADKVADDFDQKWDASKWYIFQQKLSDYLNNEEDEQLREKLIDINKISLDQLEFLTTEDIQEKLENIKKKPNWHFATEAETAWDLIKKQIGKNSKEYLIYLSVVNDEPIGFILLTVEQCITAISEIYLVGFKENSIVLARDVIDLIKQLRKEMDVAWTVKNDNPIKKAYDKIIVKWNGHSEEGNKFTRYTLRQEESLQESTQLFEMIYNKTNVILYHISTEKLSKFKKNFTKQAYDNCHSDLANVVFFSRSREMCLKYARSVLRDDYLEKNYDKYYLHYCKPTKPLDILNPSSERDKKFLKKYEIDEGELKQMAETHNWWNMEEFIQEHPSIEEKYDGFVTAQYEFSNIGIFNAHKNIKILKVEKIPFEMIADIPYQFEGDLTTFRIKESAHLIGDCRSIGENENLPYNDATDFAQSAGYYAALDEFDGAPEDSDYEEISEMKFQLACAIPQRFFKKHEYMFLKHKENPLYIAYDLDDDIHYFFMEG
jgi:hypothetical protein